MKKFLLIFLLLTLTSNAQDLKYPSGPNDYCSGFFAANYSALTAGQRTNWIEPGDRFCMVAHGTNCDGSEANAVDIASAKSAWTNSFTQCARWRTRLHHESPIFKKHSVQDVWIYYHSGIPCTKKAAIAACLEQSTFEYLGQTFSAVRTKITNRVSQAFWQNFFPGRTNIPAGNPDTVVFGKEADFQ